MSRIRADKVTDRAGTGPVTLTYGADIAGVTTAAHLNVTGVTTATTFKGKLEATTALVGSAVTISATGVNAATGIVTATSFEGSGANLTSLPEGGMSLLKTILFS